MFAFLSVIFAIGCQSEQTPQFNDEIEQIVQTYSSWPSPMSEPFNQSFDLWVLCRTLTEQEQAYLDSEHGNMETQLFVNKASLISILEQGGDRKFSSGTILVKEKTTDWDWQKGESVEMYVAGLGIMIKDKTEWTYAYWTPDGRIATGQETAHCAACHAAAAQADHVYYPQPVYDGR